MASAKGTPPLRHAAGWSDQMMGASVTYLRLTGTAFAACLIVGVGSFSACAEEAATPKALTWSYECKPGIQCPSSCSNAGKELFSTSDYVSLTISQMNDKLFWIKVDTGQKPLEFVLESDHLQCTVSGARLAYVRYQEPGAPVTAPK